MTPTPPFQAPTGTRDVLAPESYEWEGLVATYAELAYRYGFSLVMTPIFEDVGVFVRGLGEVSDVFRNEMYVFTDRGDRTLALRPEGTASVVRAFVQHHPTTPWKAWYVTPAFRYERPQAGRYRQHTQLGVEVIGTDDPLVDVEVIALANATYRAVGLRRVRLLVNSMGDRACRPAYVERLSAHLAAHEAELCDEHSERWRQNPLRVLDCKREPCVVVTAEGPMLLDHLCTECRTHFAVVREGLEAVGIVSEVNPRLVRGFDYYTRTTFEFVSEVLESAQNAIGGGGRYDGLVEELGGPAVSGIGFGSGVERILMVREREGAQEPLVHRVLDAFVVDTVGDAAIQRLVESLRGAGLAVDRAYGARSMRAQMKVADRSGARAALLYGPEEAASAAVTMRDLRAASDEGAQRRVPFDEVAAAVRALVNGGR
ncbi:MAG TPA: histidine--tRNA ligase [Acidimicrobiales bacterium]|nr:MAG: histidine--tRNA ligase [Actinobacteria bacterium 21-73-9]HQU26939.1 histidine--tRNA ligase [Acidimicrobiales bacterium]